MISTKHRIETVEVMDDFNLSGEKLNKTLNQIARINRVLGGNRITLNGLKKLLINQSKDKTFIIVDLGCGNGDMLRLIAKYGRKNHFNFKLIGIDANKNAIQYAENLSCSFDEINYMYQDVLTIEYKELDCDIVLSTLFLHHFTEQQNLKLLSKIIKKARLGVVINDLHRHPFAYYLFKLIGLTLNNPITKYDGLISIRKGFKRVDFQNMAIMLDATSRITWKWAFRYQWILQK